MCLGFSSDVVVVCVCRITLPDGTVKEGRKWETTPMDIAGEISKGLANSALISAVSDELWDMSRPLEGDCKLELFKFDSDKGRDTLWHSSAHVLGQVKKEVFRFSSWFLWRMIKKVWSSWVQALEQEYGCQLCIGPCTTRGEVRAACFWCFIFS